MGLGYVRFGGWGISFYLFALPSPHRGEGSGVRGSWRKGALLRAMKAFATRNETFELKARLTRFCERKALTPVPSPSGRGAFHSHLRFN
jgi:hypothetical protein